MTFKAVENSITEPPKAASIAVMSTTFMFVVDEYGGIWAMFVEPNTGDTVWRFIGPPDAVPSP